MVVLLLLLGGYIAQRDAIVVPPALELLGCASSVERPVVVCDEDHILAVSME
ncbi:hypothetical protein GCM10008094_12650 [Aidingimonas halophila]|nr:hypothetical protein GCM10008094_12650 [Aidingimonas halophila]